MVDSADRVDARQALATAPAEETQAADYSDKSLRELETLLEEAKGRLASANSKLAEREAELKNRSERKADLVKKLEETRQRQTQLEQKLRWHRRKARRPNLRLHAGQNWKRGRFFFVFKRSYTNQKLGEATNLPNCFRCSATLAKRESSLIKKMSALGALVDQTRQMESERQAVEARRQANLADPAIRGLAERNAELAERRAMSLPKKSHKRRQNFKILASNLAN